MQHASWFQYTGEDKAGEQGPGLLAGESTTGVKIEKYQFINKIEKKLVLIKISRLTGSRWYFNPGFYKPNIVYDSGKKKFAAKNYEYCVFPFEKNGSHLIKAIGRLSGANNNIKIEIIYAERVHGDWGNLPSLSNGQREELKSFMADSEKHIQIIE